MDQIKLNNVKKAIEMYKLFQDCLTNIYNNTINEKTEDNEQLLRFLKMQHASNLRTLEDLGLKFDDKDKIRNLNEKIRKLEEDLGNSENLQPQSISSYVSNLQNNIREFFADHGIYCHPEVTIGECFQIKLKHVSACKPFSKRDAEYLKDEAEYQKEYTKKTIQNEKAVENLLFDSQHELYFVDENTDFINEKLYEFFNDFGEIRNIKYNLSYFKHSKTEEDLKIHNIQDVSFTIATMASWLAIGDIFS